MSTTKEKTSLVQTGQKSDAKPAGPSKAEKAAKKKEIEKKQNEAFKIML